MEQYTDKYMVDVPEGQSGDWEIKRFTVSPEAAQLEALRAIFSSNRGLGVPEGTYTKLSHKQRGIIMSDTPDEIRDHLEFIHNAEGNVLINGLGLGMVTRACLQKEEVQSVTVVEISGDVIKLVGPWITKIAQDLGKALTIVHADALTWKSPKGQRYNAIWHDIWDNICGDNLATMHRLHRRYGKFCDWQASWARHLIEKR
jgi:hypothetical protein